MKILITGGAGFIGSHTAEYLLTKGFEIIIVDDLSTGHKENIPKKAEFIEADIKYNKIDNIFSEIKPEFVIHFAAQLDVRKSVKDPFYDANTNIFGTLNLLENSVKNNVKKFIMISSAGVMYGDTTEPATEEYPALPLSPYGVTKLAGESYLRTYKFNYDLNYNILRFTNVYGPRQDPHGEAGVVAIFAGQMIKKQRSKLFGFGKLERDYVFVGDVVRAVFQSLSNGNGEIFNISTAKAISVKQLYDIMSSNFQDLLEPELLPGRPGEQKRSIASYNKAEKILNWKPEISLENGLTETVKYFQSLTK